MTAALAHSQTADTLIPAELFDRLVARIVNDQDQTPERAARVMQQALAFLAACAANPGVGLGPSEQVDIGWHTFILYTHEYAEFCQRVAGRFIHHVPNDGPTAKFEPRCVLTATVDAIGALGYAVDNDLWPVAAKCNPHKCSQCHQGCTDSN
jgi:hypothetical protein